MRGRTTNVRLRRSFTALGVALSAGAAVLTGVAGASSAHAATVARAKKALLGLNDLPAGWTASPGGPTDQKDEVGVRQIASCLGVSTKTIAADPPESTGPEFDQTAEELSVNEQVQVFASAAGARADFAAIADPKAPACLTGYLNRTLVSTSTTSAVSTGKFSVSRLSFPAVGQRSTALALTLSVTDNAATIDTTLEVVVIVDNRTEATLNLTALTSSFPTQVADRLAATAARRIG